MSQAERCTSGLSMLSSGPRMKVQAGFSSTLSSPFSEYLLIPCRCAAKPKRPLSWPFNSGALPIRQVEVRSASV